MELSRRAFYLSTPLLLPPIVAYHRTVRCNFRLDTYLYPLGVGIYTYIWLSVITHLYLWPGMLSSPQQLDNC
jgi:hypothetical protein